MKKTIFLIGIMGLSVALQAADVKTIWGTECQKCHGADGKGTKLGKKQGVKDFTDPQVQASFTDEKAMATIKDGIKNGDVQKMKAYGSTYSDEEIKALVARVRSFKK